MVFLIAFAMLTFTLLLPGENWTEQLASIAFWGGASTAALFTIYMYGSDFVDMPKLVPVKDKED